VQAVTDALVIGASGLVGGALKQLAQARGLRLAGTYSSYPVDGLLPLDVSDANAVRRTILEIQPKTVYLTAALTNVDLCERDPGLSERVNVHAMRAVTDAARAIGAKLVTFSSDYVFDGAAGPYTEDAAPNPLNVYGKHKLEAERIALEGDALVLRTCGVYGAEAQGKNFVVRLIQGNRAGQTWRIPVDQYANPTLARDLARAALDGAHLSGVYHAAGATFLNRHAFALEIARIFDLDISRLVAVDTPSLNQAAPRPLRGGLTSTRLETALGWHFSGLEGLQTLL
jgi:dTDP-4-dehydrorhamnose reductase